MAIRPAQFDRKRKRRAALRKLGSIATVFAIIAAGLWFQYGSEITPRDAALVTQEFGLCGQGANAACVADGDTVILGGGETRRRVRLTGYDAPELDGACEAERTKAREARTALHQWLGQGQFAWDGGEPAGDARAASDGPPYDQYGRELRSAWRDDPEGKREFLADHMLALGLASESGWGADEIDWCA